MFKEKVLVVAVNHLDFVPKDTDEHVRGDKVWYVRNCYDDELNRGWLGMKILQSVFVRFDSSIELPDFPSFPCMCDFVYSPAGRRNILSAIEISGDKK